MLNFKRTLLILLQQRKLSDTNDLVETRWEAHNDAASAVKCGLKAPLIIVFTDAVTNTLFA